MINVIQLALSLGYLLPVSTLNVRERITVTVDTELITLVQYKDKLKVMNDILINKFRCTKSPRKLLGLGHNVGWFSMGIPVT